MIFLVILLTIAVLVVLVLYYFQTSKLEYYKTVSQNISTMAVIQQMFEIMGSTISAKQKIENLNQVIIKSYGVKYSTIAIYDGTTYEIKATNVEKTYLDSISQIAKEPDFKDNALRNVSKYITTSPDKTLTYKSAIERQIKSCMFSPIYYNDMYLGFWVIEDEVENAFDNISKDDLAKLKNNMGVFIESLQNQSVIEMAENTDKLTGFYNNLYLYANVVSILNSKPSSALILMCINNIDDINEKFGRVVADNMIVKVSDVIKDMISEENIKIRYSGKRILIVCPDSNADSMQPLIERLLTHIKGLEEYNDDKKIEISVQFVLHTFRRQQNVEKELQKMVSYIDKMQENNSMKLI